MKIPAFLRLTIRNIIVNIDIGTLIFMLGLPTLYLFVMGFMFQGIVTTGVPLQSGGSVSMFTIIFLMVNLRKAGIFIFQPPS